MSGFGKRRACVPKTGNASEIISAEMRCTWAWHTGGQGSSMCGTRAGGTAHEAVGAPHAERKK